MSWNIAKPGDQINGPVAVTGNLNVDSNTLFVDSANNRVGVLTASPTVPLDVVGDAKVSGNLTVDTNTLVVDAANNRLGIGTATPATALHVFGTGSQALSVERDGATIQSRLEIISGNSTNLIRATVAKDLLVEQGTGTEVLRIATNGVCTWSNVGGVAGTAMTLNATGLGVGAVPTAAAIHSAKATAANPTGGSAANAGLYVSAVNQLYGMMFGVNGVGAGWIQQQRSDATNTQYDLALQPLGGNCGIGTATPGGKLEVFLTSTSDPSIRLRYNSTSVYANHLMNGGGDYVVESPAANGVTSGNMRLRAGATFSIATNNSAATSPQLSLDTAGNLGLGVTPKAWRTSVVFKAFQIGYTGALYSLGASEQVNLASNYYQDTSGNELRIENGYVTRYQQASGAHIWSNAGTGNAGTGFTLTPAMTLDPSGNLGLANVIPSSWLYNGFSVGSGTGNFGVTIYSGTSNNGILAFADGSSSTARYSGYIQYAHGNDSMEFATQSTGRLSIKSTGQVNFVGQASDPAGAAAGDVYYNTTTNKLKCYNGTTWNDLF